MADHPMRLTGVSRGRGFGDPGCNMCGGGDKLMHETVEVCEGRLRRGYVCNGCLPKFQELSPLWEAAALEGAEGQARLERKAEEDRAREEKTKKIADAKAEAERNRRWAAERAERDALFAREKAINDENIRIEALSNAARAREQERLRQEHYASRADTGIF